MEDADPRQPLINEAVHQVPCNVVTLTTPRQCMTPVPHDLEAESGKRRAVGWDGMICEIAAYHFPEPTPLFGYRIVLPFVQLLSKRLQSLCKRLLPAVLLRRTLFAMMG